MIRYEDQCVGCPPHMGCLGSCCPKRNIPVYICDRCDEEAEELYTYDDDDRQLCFKCLWELHNEEDIMDNARKVEG